MHCTRSGLLIAVWLFQGRRDTTEFTGSLLLHVFCGDCVRWTDGCTDCTEAVCCSSGGKWSWHGSWSKSSFPVSFGIFWNSSISGGFDDIIPIGINWFSCSFLDFSKLNDFCISWEMSCVAWKNVRMKFAFAASVWADLLMSISWMIASSLHQTNIFLGATLSLTQVKVDLLNTQRRLP